jgi:hypothetical protein
MSSIYTTSLHGDAARKKTRHRSDEFEAELHEVQTRAAHDYPRRTILCRRVTGVEALPRFVRGRAN